MANYTLRMGAMSPKLSEQINGLPKVFDEFADAVTLLSVHGLLAGSEAHNARKRIVKKIEKWDDEQGKKQALESEANNDR